MFEFMLKHPVLACRRGKLYDPHERKLTHRLWLTLSDKLNAAGPPVKDVRVWRKSYKNQKHRVRKKISRNKTLTLKKIKMSALEEKLMEVAGLNNIPVICQKNEQAAAADEYVQQQVYNMAEVKEEEEIIIADDEENNKMSALEEKLMEAVGINNIPVNCQENRQAAAADEYVQQEVYNMAEVKEEEELIIADDEKEFIQNVNENNNSEEEEASPLENMVALLNEHFQDFAKPQNLAASKLDKLMKMNEDLIRMKERRLQMRAEQHAMDMALKQMDLEIKRLELRLTLRTNSSHKL